MDLIDNAASKARSFWDRPEGTTGMVTLAVGGVGVFFAMPYLLAFMGSLVLLLGQTLAVVAMCGVLGIVLAGVANPRMRTLVSYAFRSAMRGLTGMWVTIDPIGVMKNCIEDKEKEQENILKIKAKLSSQISILKKQIKANSDTYTNAMGIAKVAQQRGNQAQVSLNSRKAERLQQLNKENYLPMLQTMEANMRALDKFSEVTSIVVEDIRNVVEVETQKRETMRTTYGAMMATKKILNGKTPEREMYEMALENVVGDYELKLAEIDSFISSSQSFVDGLDMQNEAYDASALAKLQEWEQKADSILLGPVDKQQLLLTADTGNVPTGMPMVAQVVDYASLVRNKK